jgi:predicted amidohydrolase
MPVVDTHSRSIAVAQTCPVKGDVQANLDEHIRLAQLAAAEGADVVMFPELSLTGYELTLADRLAFSESDDPRLSSLLDVAASRRTILVVGGPVRVGSFLYIGAFILYPDRTTELYTKHHLGAFPPTAICDSCDGSVPPPEATVFQPGDCNPLLHFGDNIAAVAVCADIGRPAHPQQAAARNANTYLASMFVIPSDLEGEYSKLSRYAVQHRMMTALANFGGPSGGLRSAGHSAIWSEAGELLVQLQANNSGIAVVTETQDGRRCRAIMAGHSATG